MNQLPYLRQQATISTANKLNVPNNRLVDQPETSPHSRPIYHMAIKDDNMLRAAGGLTPLNLDMNQNGNDQSGMMGIKKGPLKFYHQGSVLDKSTTNRQHKMQFQQRGQADGQVSASEKLSQYFNNYNASETPMQYIKNMGGDASLLNNRYLLSFSQAQADVNGTMQPVSQMQAIQSGLKIKTNNAINISSDQNNYQPSSATPVQLKNIDEQSITQLKKQTTCQTMMNISQVDGGGTSTVRAENNTHLQNMIVDKQNNKYRYSLFKDEAATTSNMLIQQPNFNQSMVDATDEVPTGKRGDSNLYVTAPVGGLQGHPHQAQMTSSKHKNSATSSVPTGSNKVQVDFTMMTQYRQQELQSKIHGIDGQTSAKADVHVELAAEDNFNLMGQDASIPDTIRPDAKIDMHRMAQDSKVLANNRMASKLMIGSQIDQGLSKMIGNGINSKSLQYVDSKPKQQQQVNDQLINESNHGGNSCVGGDSSRNQSQPMRQINFLSSKLNQSNQLTFSQRMNTVQPREPRLAAGTNLLNIASKYHHDQSSRVTNKYLTLPANTFQMAGITKHGFESNSNYQSVQSPGRIQDQQRSSLTPLNLRNQFLRNNYIERGSLSKTLMKQSYLEGTATPDQNASNANTGRYQSADISQVLGQNQVSQKSCQNSSPKFAKAAVQKQVDQDNEQNPSLPQNQPEVESNTFKPLNLSSGTFRLPAASETNGGGSTRGQQINLKGLNGQATPGVDQTKLQVRTPSSFIAKTGLIQNNNGGSSILHRSSFGRAVNAIQYSDKRKYEGGIHFGYSMNNQVLQNSALNTPRTNRNINLTLKQLQGQNQSLINKSQADGNDCKTNTAQRSAINIYCSQADHQVNVQDQSPTKIGTSANFNSDFGTMNLIQAKNVDFGTAAMQFSKQRIGQNNHLSSTFSNQSLRAIQKVSGQNAGQIPQATASCAFMTPQSRGLTPIHNKPRLLGNEQVRLNSNNPQHNHSNPNISNTIVNTALSNAQKLQLNKLNGQGNFNQDPPDSMSQRSETAPAAETQNGIAQIGNGGSLPQNLFAATKSPHIQVVTSTGGHEQPKINSASQRLNQLNQGKQHLVLASSVSGAREPVSADAMKKAATSESISIQKSMQSPEIAQANKFDQSQKAIQQMNQAQQVHIKQQQNVSLGEIHQNQIATNQLLTEILQNQRKIELKQHEQDKLITQNISVSKQHHASHQYYHHSKRQLGQNKQIKIIIQEHGGGSSMRNSLLSASVSDASPNRAFIQKMPLNTLKNNMVYDQQQLSASHLQDQANHLHQNQVHSDQRDFAANQGHNNYIQRHDQLQVNSEGVAQSGQEQLDLSQQHQNYQHGPQFRNQH